MRYLLVLTSLVGLLGCGDLSPAGRPQPPLPSASPRAQAAGPDPAQTPPDDRSRSQVTRESLVAARRGFVTRLVRTGPVAGPPDDPTGSPWELIRYVSPVGELAAYVTPNPGDGVRHAAILWITGGDCNSLHDIWSERPRARDLTARAFREAGFVVLTPSLRGGNDNPGRREGLLGEVDDVLAATRHLAGLPYVDAGQLYLGGHSAGGALVMLVAASSDQYRGVFALGPVANAWELGEEGVYCDLNDPQEVRLRSPIHWLHCVQSPLWVFEGAERGNWESCEIMSRRNDNPQIQFAAVPGHDHESVVAPLTELLARKLIQGSLQVTAEDLQNLK